MADLNLVGKLIRKTEVIEVTENFKKQEFVIETDEQYPQKVQFQLVQGNTGKIDSFNIQDKIQVYFNVTGKEWQKDADSPKKIFNSLNAWRIVKM